MAALKVYKSIRRLLAPGFSPLIARACFLFSYLLGFGFGEHSDGEPDLFSAALFLSPLCINYGCIIKENKPNANLLLLIRKVTSECKRSDVTNTLEMNWVMRNSLSLISRKKIGFFMTFISCFIIHFFVYIIFKRIVKVCLPWTQLVLT